MLEIANRECMNSDRDVENLGFNPRSGSPTKISGTAARKFSWIGTFVSGQDTKKNPEQLQLTHRRLCEMLQGDQ